ncbi:CoA-binding protein [Actinoplanes sp. SE50]|uniref:GNAT family N-acetyltransferase n=1 Tax=unclassified Actinoplanes TaxID=2626549 RepID=UPI00023ED24F|nr:MULTISPECIES: GNAT family N-acetyltransferase [unclassified Actinoplanes]AEV84953.1 CoA-binding domain protein [Actinoplanes sp. SE50/110]ATO83344.1 CoA-binding protein [Actinoplanes sp. SE50]SLM00751.1 GNAT family N-acetyltransferase [Actinoplanes sp. SE50/110]
MTLTLLASDGGVVTLRPARPGDRTGMLRFRLAAAATDRIILVACAGPPPPDAAKDHAAEKDAANDHAAEKDAANDHATAKDAANDHATQKDAAKKAERAERAEQATARKGAPPVIGVAAYARLDPAGRTAEIAVHVAPHHRGRGIATLLVEQLTAHARQAGITELIGPGPDGGTELRPMLTPASVVVIGAGPRHGGAGHETLRALRDYGFAGRLYAVNPAGRPVCGVPAYRSVSDLPEPADLAVVAVRADLVPAALKEAGRCGVRCAVVLSKGFASSGPVSRQRRAEVLQVAREQGVRLLGPSSIGVLNTGPDARLNACLSPERPPAGGLALAAQSGPVGIALLAGAARGGCGVASFVSLGEGLDVTENDLVTHWFDDPATRAVGLCLESVRDPAGFATLVRALGRRKPVLAVSRAGALLESAGVICTTGIGEMLDTARMLIGQPAPAGARMAIVGNGGGLTGQAADLAEAAGFTLLPLTSATRRQVARGRDNPVDLGIDATPASIAAAAETVANSGEADTLLLIIVGTRANCPIAIMTALGEVVDGHPDVTIAAVLTGGNDGIQTFGSRAAPVYPDAARAVRALAYAHRYAVWRNTDT